MRFAWLRHVAVYMLNAMSNWSAGMIRWVFLYAAVACSSLCFADDVHELSLPLLKGERWHGGVVSDAHLMPFREGYSHDLLADAKGNQAQPLLISTRGRWVWSDAPFSFSFDDGELRVESVHAPIQHGAGGDSLSDAYLAASHQFFPPAGRTPPREMFALPQYNTWIELMYDQNQVDIEAYARGIIDNGFPSGVLMIDDNWQEDYGVWRFHPGRFSDPKAMTDALRELGFRVMLWVCPFVSPDSMTYRELHRERLLVYNAERLRDPAMIFWWNGVSASLDFTNPGARDWFVGELSRLQDEYGVDGFKLDGGDAKYYTGVESHEPALPNDHSEWFGHIGLEFPFNEYRAMWKNGGQPLAQRLRDKSHSWDDLAMLVPGILTQGLMGYPYACPDLIGGGEYRSFLNLDQVDQELIVRSAQCHALMPMMQFSVAPWRVLDEAHLAACREAAWLHVQFGRLIFDLAVESAGSGEPIVRSMEYVFPHQGYADVSDQFLLGDSILVAPVIESGARSREVAFPPGRWQRMQVQFEWDGGEPELELIPGVVVEGPIQQTVEARLDELPFFVKVNE